jgi:exopolysaccharide biosynthesis polyprenyl glycosylphosphotransferase
VTRRFSVAASVGTYHHPFDRFVSWLEPWTSAHADRVVFQHGSTRPIPGAENHEMLAPARLLEIYREADAVVIQGGAGGVMDARKAGRIPIVVPRKPVDDEVVDDHQIVLSRKLASMGLVHVAESPAELQRLLDGVAAGTVPSRTTRGRPTAGVARAVQTLSTLAPRRTSRRAARAAPSVIPFAPSPGTKGDPGRTTRSRRTRRRSLRSSVRAVARQGLIGYLLTFVVALLLLDRLAVSRDVALATGGIVAVWLGYSFAALPAYERARSSLPSLRFLGIVGTGVVAGLAAGLPVTTELRQALAVLLAAAAVLALSGHLHRRLLRRGATVLVGEERAVRRLEQRWRDRRDVSVAATCVWQGSAELIPMEATNSLAGIVPDVLASVRRNNADAVVITSERALTTPALRHLAWALQRADIECLVLADMKDHVEYLRPQLVGGQVALTMRPPNHHLVSVLVKSLLDRVLAASALLVLAPLMLVIAAAVRLTSPGPAVFRQERTGRDGKPFTMLKFRTMVVDAEERLADLRLYNEGAGPLFKLANDPRITPVGRVLRRTSLDELPQLLNVLRGDMSLVGPRPALPKETEAYSEWVWRRLHVRPGLTGLWQVSGRSQLTWEESIRIDLEYVNNWNLRLDLRILARTLRAVVARDGAL